MPHAVTLRDKREFAHRMVDAAPNGYILRIEKPRRSNDQNALLWSLLTRISAAKPDGRELVPEVWKSVFCHALGHEQRFEMALDGKGFIPLGFRTSKMSKEQMSELIEFIRSFAAQHEIEIGE